MALAPLYVASSLTLCPGAAGSHSVVSAALCDGRGRMIVHISTCTPYLLLIYGIQYKVLGVGLVYIFKSQANPSIPSELERQVQRQ